MGTGRAKQQRSFVTESLSYLPCPLLQIIGSLYGWAAGGVFCFLQFRITLCRVLSSFFQPQSPHVYVSPCTGLESRPSNATIGSGVSVQARCFTAPPLHCSRWSRSPSQSAAAHDGLFLRHTRGSTAAAFVHLQLGKSAMPDFATRTRRCR